MKRIVITTVVSVCMMVLIGGIQTSFAQGPGQGRGFRGGDPEEMNQWIMSRFQERLNASDDEWEVIQPLLEKVWNLQRESRSAGPGMGFFGFGGPGGPGGFGGPGGPGGPDGEGGVRIQRSERQGERGDVQQGDRGNRPGRFERELSPEAQALQSAIEAEGTAADDIKAKLSAYRTAQKNKEAELQKSREELRQVLTLRQEAILVLMGTMD